jgi:hypothetical protein
LCALARGILKTPATMASKRTRMRINMRVQHGWMLRPLARMYCPHTYIKETPFRMAGTEVGVRPDPPVPEKPRVHPLPRATHANRGGRVTMANSPFAVRGHCSAGRSQYNSTSLSSGSRRYSAWLTPWSAAPSSEMPARSTRRNPSASSARVG